MAHRDQLRMCKHQDNFQKPIIQWGRQQLQPETSIRASGEEFKGFSESEIRRGRKRKYVVENSTNENEEVTGLAPRRSKRLRKVKVNEDFVY